MGCESSMCLPNINYNKHIALEVVYIDHSLARTQVHFALNAIRSSFPNAFFRQIHDGQEYDQLQRIRRCADIKISYKGKVFHDTTINGYVHPSKSKQICERLIKLVAKKRKKK